ncbi:glycosyltransferase family 2 protein [Actinoplanes sp. NPDC048967]|uniref:glycosyltransferase family 2 protein n=1 Tax=Actinoplanes sp. NPDC048967 TaxID=3155269 RepID=UPI0033DDB83D
MTATTSWALSLLLIPLAWLLIDATGGLRARHAAAPAVGTDEFHDFAVLVPIYGNIKYLENIDYLSRYGRRVILCTTTGETPEFDVAITEIACRQGFRVFRTPADKASTTANRRATGGTIRDTVIRAVLPTVDAAYVVCIDADTTTSQPLELLVGALHRRGLDVASIRLVPSNRDDSLLTRFQAHEYRLSMKLRVVAPWLVSGACHAARTTALRDVMNNHSLFFQGNDVETGILADAMGFQIGHVPFEVPTKVPNTLKDWWRQHVAWAGGEFRLFVVNAGVGLRHPFFWCYGLIITLAMLPLRLLALGQGHFGTVGALVALYIGLGFYLHWSHRDYALLLMPLYAAFISVVLVPLGAVSYIQMARRGRNAGIIRVPRRARNGTSLLDRADVQVGVRA